MDAQSSFVFETTPNQGTAEINYSALRQLNIRQS